MPSSLQSSLFTLSSISCKKTTINQWRALQYLHFRDLFSAERPKWRRRPNLSMSRISTWNNRNARQGLWFSARCKIITCMQLCKYLTSNDFLPIGQFCRYLFFRCALSSGKQKLQDNNPKSFSLSLSVSLSLSRRVKIQRGIISPRATVEYWIN